jgi:uncharacterized membrane protein
MIYLPVTLLLFLVLLLLLPFIWFALAIDIVEVAVAKLGFSPEIALLLLLAVIIGSTINIPLYEKETEIPITSDLMELWLRQFWGIPLQKTPQKSIIAINVGGGLIPIGLAIYELFRSDALEILLVAAIVTVISYFASQVVPGIGIQMNPLIGPLTASLSAVLLGGGNAPAVAFAGGVLGVLIGADLLNLGQIGRTTPGVLSIGGAGVFDGIALCGLFALLLT